MTIGDRHPVAAHPEREPGTAAAAAGDCAGDRGRGVVQLHPGSLGGQRGEARAQHPAGDGDAALRGRERGHGQLVPLERDLRATAACGQGDPRAPADERALRDACGEPCQHQQRQQRDADAEDQCEHEGRPRRGHVEGTAQISVEGDRDRLRCGGVVFRSDHHLDASPHRAVGVVLGAQLEGQRRLLTLRQAHAVALAGRRRGDRDSAGLRGSADHLGGVGSEPHATRSCHAERGLGGGLLLEEPEIDAGADGREILRRQHAGRRGGEGGLEGGALCRGLAVHDGRSGGDLQGGDHLRLAERGLGRDRDRDGSAQRSFVLGGEQRVGVAAGVGERDIAGEGPAELGGVDDLPVRAVHEGERSVGHLGSLADLGALEIPPLEDERRGEVEVHGDLLARRGRGRIEEADPPGAVPGVDGLGVELELDRPRSEPGCLGAALGDGLGARAGGEAQGLGLPRRDHVGLEPLDVAAREHAHRAERAVQDEGDLSCTALLALADLDARGAQRVARRGQRIEGHEQGVEVVHLEVAALRRGDVTALLGPVALSGFRSSALGDAAQEGEVGALRHQADADDRDPRAAQLVGDAGRPADVLLARGDRLGRTRVVGERDLRGVGLRLAVVATALAGLARVDVVLSVAEPEHC